MAWFLVVARYRVFYSFLLSEFTHTHTRHSNVLLKQNCHLAKFSKDGTNIAGGPLFEFSELETTTRHARISISSPETCRHDVLAFS